MNKSDAAAVIQSDLKPFLYSGVAVERSDMEVTVLSALARQGLDPWREAERLAKLPHAVAAQELARTFSVARLPESTSMADHLVALLPRGGQATPVQGVAKAELRQPSMKWMLAAMAAGVLSSFIFASAPKPADTVAPASWFTENVPASHAPGVVREAEKPAAAPSRGSGEAAPLGAITPPA